MYFKNLGFIKLLQSIFLNPHFMVEKYSID